MLVRGGDGELDDGELRLLPFPPPDVLSVLLAVVADDE